MTSETPRDPRPDRSDQPTRSERPSRPEEERLGQTWDDLLARPGHHVADAADEYVTTIEQLHARDDIPPLDGAMRARIWRDAVAIAGIAQSAPLPSPAAVRPNGHHAVAAAAVPHAPRGGPVRWSEVAAGGRRRWAVVPWLSGAVRTLAIGALAGMLAGAAAGGIVGRVVMRIVGLMAEPWQQGLATENGNPVGEITLGGSLELLVFAAIVGVAGGVLYVLVRPWLPGNGLGRGAVFGALLLLTSGWVVMDPENADYRRFGVPGINIALFGLVYLVFGLIVAPAADRLDRAIPAAWPVRSRRAPVLAGSALLILLAAPAILMVAGLAASPSGLLLSALLLGARALVPRWAGRFERPADLMARPRVAVAAYAAIGVPALIGATLTLRALGEILGSG